MIINPYRFGVSGGDPNFSSVVFLAGFEGADGATTYSEEKNSRTATFVGNAQIDTADFKFGSASALFDGSGDAITFADNADWDLSNANSDQFTIEAWVKRVAVTDIDRTIIAQSAAAGTLAWKLAIPNVASSTELAFSMSTNGLSFDTIINTTSAGITASAWHHVAVDKDSGGKIRVYANGTMRGSSTPADSSIFDSSAVLSIGASNGIRVWKGWIDEVRITKGVARYASDSGYTPPTAAFPRF